MKREKKAVRWILIFFAAMLVFTILSRAADSMTIPKVQVESIHAGTLDFSIEGEGILAAETEKVVFFPAGVKAVELLTSGTEVKKGEALAIFDTEALKEREDTCKAELKKLEISMEQETLNGTADARTKEEDSAKRTEGQASQELKEAKKELAKKQEEYKKKVESGESAEEEIQALEEEIQAWEAEVKTRKQALKEAQNVLEDAKENDANAKINEQKQENIAKLAKEGIQVDIEQKKKELKQIQKLIAAEGKMPSPLAGTITEVKAETGTETSGQEYFKIGTGNTKMTAQMEKDAVEKLKLQDKLTVISVAEENEIKGEVTAIEDEGDNKVMMIASLEENPLRIGTSVEFKATITSKEYDAVVPLGAIREDSQGKYVLVVKEENSILGKEEKASRISVKIQEKNNAQAAVESALQADDKIIVSSNKSISEGDRVRISDE